MKRSRASSQDAETPSSDDDSGENLMENLESDYAAIPELDQYDEDILDDREYDQIDIAVQRAAEVRLLREAS